MRPETTLVTASSSAFSAPVPLSHTAPSQALSLWERLWYLARRHTLRAALRLIWFPWHWLLRPGHPRPPASAEAVLFERFQALLSQDLRNAEAGLYPRELLFQHRLGEYLLRVPEALAQLWPILRRARRGSFAELPAEVNLASYPDYYRRTFHWQPGGWFSTESARLYDFSVDALFLATTDIMRRMSLPPLVEALRHHPQPRVLDVACGTGRFLSQLHQALPRAALTGVDLSPFYVRHAQQVLAGLPGARVVEGNAEQLPFADHSFDAVTCVYLFHELPAEVRRRVARELKRVLAPGGRLVLCDAIQRTEPESAPLEPYMRWFNELYHEPFFPEYSRDDLGALLTEAGFQVETSSTFYFSKVVVAVSSEGR
jgi:ubiquinone/menaquinone biosynthesis C-methylase UbiE